MRLNPVYSTIHGIFGGGKFMVALFLNVSIKGLVEAYLHKWEIVGWTRHLSRKSLSMPSPQVGRERSWSRGEGRNRCLRTGQSCQNQLSWIDWRRITYNECHQHHQYHRHIHRQCSHILIQLGFDDVYMIRRGISSLIHAARGCLKHLFLSCCWRQW